MTHDRSGAFHGISPVFLFDTKGLEAHGVDMMRHATEVDGLARLTLIQNGLHVDRAVLILDRLGLAGWQLTTGLNHEHLHLIGVVAHNVLKAHERVFRELSRDQVCVVVLSLQQRVHGEFHRLKVGLHQQVGIDVLLHVAASKLFLTVVHDAEGCL